MRLGLVRPNKNGTTHFEEKNLQITYLLTTCYIQMGPSNVLATGLSKIGNALNNVSLCFWL